MHININSLKQAFFYISKQWRHWPESSVRNLLANVRPLQIYKMSKSKALSSFTTFRQKHCGILNLLKYSHSFYTKAANN